MLLTATVFDGSRSSFHQWSGFYCVTHHESFNQIGLVWNLTLLYLFVVGSGKLVLSMVTMTLKSGKSFSLN